MALAYLTINLDDFTGDDHPPISQYSTITLDPGADHIDEDADVIHVRTIVVSLDQQGKAATANGVPCVDGKVPVVAGVMYAVLAPNVLRDGPHYIPALTAGQVVDLSDYITPGAPLTPDQAAILTARIKALETTPPDHGALTGLGDDDHPQYLTTGRGDERYVQGSDSRLTLADTAVQPGEVADFALLVDVDTTGTTDAAPTINAAVTSLSALGGGTVTLPKGSIRLDTPIIPKDGVRVRGLGPGTVLYPRQEGFTYTTGSTSTPLSNFHISDLIIDGTHRTGTFKGYHGQFHVGCSWTNLIVRNTGMTGLGPDKLRQCLISNVTTEDTGLDNDGTQPSGNGIGIGAGGWTDHESFSIVNCNAIRAKRYGIMVEGSDSVSGAKIIGNFATGCGSAGFGLAHPRPRRRPRPSHPPRRSVVRRHRPRHRRRLVGAPDHRPRTDRSHQGDTMKTAAAILAALIAFTLGLLSCTPPANSAESTPGVTYSAHVQRIGWQAPVDDGATAGTTGRAPARRSAATLPLRRRHPDLARPRPEGRLAGLARHPRHDRHHRPRAAARGVPDHREGQGPALRGGFGGVPRARPRHRVAAVATRRADRRHHREGAARRGRADPHRAGP
jgi:hypothetical protein